ncbi:MAG: hypothetical protein R2810_01085 [Flavobacteriales bacterium]
MRRRAASSTSLCPTSARTSKGTLNARTVWYLLVEDQERPGITGIG